MIPRTRTPPLRPPTSLRMTLALLTVALLFAVAGAPAAPASGADDVRAQRDEIRRSLVAAANQAELLGAEDDRLRAALDGLDRAVTAQRARVADAARRVESARREADRAAAELAPMEALVADARRAAAQFLVRRYVDAAGEQASVWLDAESPSQAARKAALLGELHGGAADALEQLRVAVDEQRRAQQGAAAALAVAEAERAKLAEEAAELDAERRRQGELEAELRSRLEGWQAKADELEADEARLTALIMQAEGTTPGRGVRLASGLSAAGFEAPIEGGGITSGFGMRRHPVLHSVRLHAGLDFGARSGTPVHAAKAGVVLAAGWHGGYGNAVVIQHDGGVSTLYGHLSAIETAPGARVSRGTVVGRVGSTGLSTGPHLHFETRVDGVPVDPLQFLGSARR